MVSVVPFLENFNRLLMRLVPHWQDDWGEADAALVKVDRVQGSGR